jgi:lipoprotein NlpD
VQAAADGEVVYSGKDLASYGNLVILRHDDNYLTAYSKVNDIIVKENQKVRAGDVIAILGSDQAQGTELHFEIRHNGEPVNPVDYLPAL